MHNVVDFMARLRAHRSHWMRDPSEWVWSLPDGRHQGFGHIWREHIGRTNLLWLALDLPEPPRGAFNANSVPLYMHVLLHSQHMQLDGEPLQEQAAILTLAQFRNLLATAPFTATPPARNVAPLLHNLASQRLENAHA